MHYYYHHIGDFVRDTANLSDHQLATYLRMLWTYYDTEKPLIGDPEDIAFAMRSDEKTVLLLLKHYFKKTERGWEHARCEKEIAIYHGKAEKARASANARWKNANGMRTHSERIANANETDANQEPITNNQESITTTSPRKRGKESAKLVTVADLMIDGIDHDLALEFLAHRAKLKASLTPRAWEAIKREAGGINWLPAQAVEKMLARGWRGFESAWITKELGQQSGPFQGRQLNKQELLEQHNAEVGRRWLEKQQQEDGTYDPAR